MTTCVKALLSLRKLFIFLRRGKMEDSLVIGVDFSNKNDIDTMVVGRIRNDQSIDIVNAFQGDEARELYEKLITNK